jgi:CRISPR-associated exonuclease Cas4
MEQTSKTVAEGKLISETTYSHRAAKFTELDLGVAKIDFYDAKNKVVHEVKKSNKLEHAHIWQTKYYLHLLKQMGIEGATGIIEYPKLRITEPVELTQEDEAHIEKAVRETETLINQENCPKRIEKKYCKSCSYFEFCWVGGDE